MKAQKRTQVATAPKIKPDSIGIIQVIVAHLLIAAGILYIGERMKNKNEIYAGAIFFLVAIGLLLAQYVAYPCSGACDSGLGGAAYANCGACDLHNNLGTIFGILSLASWLYIAVRLYLIHQNKESTIKII